MQQAALSNAFTRTPAPTVRTWPQLPHMAEYRRRPFLVFGSLSTMVQVPTLSPGLNCLGGATFRIRVGIMRPSSGPSMGGNLYRPSVSASSWRSSAFVDNLASSCDATFSTGDFSWTGPMLIPLLLVSNSSLILAFNHTLPDNSNFQKVRDGDGVSLGCPCLQMGTLY